MTSIASNMSTTTQEREGKKECHPWPPFNQRRSSICMLHRSESRAPVGQTVRGKRGRARGKSVRTYFSGTPLACSLSITRKQPFKRSCVFPSHTYSRKTLRTVLRNSPALNTNTLTWVRRRVELIRSQPTSRVLRAGLARRRRRRSIVRLSPKLSLLRFSSLQHQHRRGRRRSERRSERASEQTDAARAPAHYFQEGRRGRERGEGKGWREGGRKEGRGAKSIFVRA